MSEVMICAGYPPSANRYWRHANGKTYKSEEATLYQRTVRMEALASGVRRPMSGKIAIHITLHPVAPKDYAKRLAKGTGDSVRCMDLDNAIKVLFDALNGVVIEDDSQVRQIVAERGEPTMLGGVTVRVSQMEDAR